MMYVHDIIAISGLAIRVSIAYKDTPDGYSHIPEEVATLRLLIDKVAPHFKSTIISQEDYHYGEKVLRNCQSALEGLNSYVEKYKRLAPINKTFEGVKLGNDDIASLQVRLIVNTVLLNGFIRRYVVCPLSILLIQWILILLSSCEYKEVQVRLAALFGLHADSRISVTSIASFAANTNTEMAYKQFCEELYQIGVTEDMILQNKDKILEILRSQGMVASSQLDSSKVEDNKDQELEMAYKEFCLNLQQSGVTEDMLLPKAKILEILRSRSMVASSQTGGSRNIGDGG